MRCHLAIVAGLTSLLMLQPLAAQQPDRSTARNQLSQRFDSKGPAVGEKLPDVSAYTADGRKFSLSDVKEQYTVLVFGCLT